MDAMSRSRVEAARLRPVTGKSGPLIGKGYGGLENAWVFSDTSQIEDVLLEVDLASGGIHNGYLTGAYSLGIPAVLFFLIAFIGQMIMSFGLWA